MKKRARAALALALSACLALLALSCGCSKPSTSEEASSSGSLDLEVNDAGAKSTSSKSSASSSSLPSAANVVMALKGDKDTVVVAGEDYIESGCQAIDKERGVVTSKVQISGQVDASTPGDYEVAYTLVGDDGTTATQTRNVHVVDKMKDIAKKLPVLMYHYVYSEQNPPASLNGNYLLDTKLDAQCKWLKDNDYYFPSFEELYSWVLGNHTLPEKSVVLTFDDGDSYFFEYGVPVLERNEVPATSFVIGSKCKDKVKKYASPYIQYQSHSYNMHRPGGSNIGRGGVIYDYSADDIADDLKKSNKITGKATAFAYPFGDNDKNAQQALKDAGILCAFTIVNDKISKGDDPMALNRVRISGEYSTESFKYLVSPSN